MKDKGIKLSPKYGVNPTIPVCFWCGEEKNEIALLGHLANHKGEDIEAPRRMVMDYEPCDKCKENMSKGFMLIETTQAQPQEGMPPIADDHYPTGRWCVISQEAAERIFSSEYTTKSKLLVDTEIYTKLVKHD